MGKIYCALGLMSGTSGDGVDASIIKSDGKDQILIENNITILILQVFQIKFTNLERKFKIKRFK